LKRRDFITLVGCASAMWPLSARAQQAALPLKRRSHSSTTKNLTAISGNVRAGTAPCPECSRKRDASFQALISIGDDVAPLSIIAPALAWVFQPQFSGHCSQVRPCKLSKRWYSVLTVTVMPAHQGKFIAYFRVSTERQGKSGLGLDAQRKSVLDYLDGGRWELVAEFTEIESGKRSDRPELAKALAACKRQKAKLVIAKLDRLSRNLAFIATLMDSGVEFIAVDNPHANKLTVHILAAVAQHEREMISARTSAALKAAKGRGKRLGNPKLVEARKQAARARIERADRYSANVLPVIREIQESGVSSLRGIARALAARGVPTARGGSWTPVQVSDILRRAG
jgi:DNA invertase Pin-like site-specific DNA recombinase